MEDKTVVFSSGLAQVFSIRPDDKRQNCHIQVRELIDCDVYLLANSLSLDADKLSHTNAFVGPCSGRVILSDCNNCMFTVACEQLVLRNCNDCIIYLYSATDPSFSECGRIKVAPFNASWPGLGRQFELAGFDPGNNHWNHICDLGQTNSSTGANCSVIMPGFVVDRENNKLTDFGVLKLREAFDKFDEDNDNALSWIELHALQKAIRAEDLVRSKEDLGEFFAGGGISLNADGALPFEGFCKLYADHPDDVARDLALIGINLATLQANNIAMAGYEFEEEANSVPVNVDEVVSRLGPSINPVEQATLNLKPCSFASVPTTDEPLTGTSAFVNNDMGKVSASASSLPLQVQVPNSSSKSIPQELRYLLHESSVKGVDALKWFVQFEVGNQYSMSITSFEKALSGLLLGLCLADSTKFEPIVTRVLEKKNIFALQQLFPDPSTPGNVHYRNMLLRLFAKRQGTHQPGGGITSPRHAVRKANEICNSLDELESKVAKHLPNMNDAQEHVREVLQRWKWSTNTKLFAVDSHTDDAISRVILASSLVNVFEELGGLTVPLSVTQDLVTHLQENFETGEESRARHACFHDDAIVYNVQNKEHHYLKNLPKTTISIPSILRWTARIARQNGMSFETWKESKLSKGCEKSTEALLVKQATQGNKAAVERLFRAKNIPRTARAFAKYYQFPEEIIQNQVSHDTNQWIHSALGRAAIRKRVVRNSAGGDENKQQRGVKQAATNELVKEKREQLLYGWKNDPNVPFNLFLKFAIRSKAGYVGTFENWLVTRSETWKRSEEALKQWNSEKRLSMRSSLSATQTSKQSENGAKEVALSGSNVVFYGYVTTIESKVRSLFQRSYQSKSTSQAVDMVVHRSSRYVGLDPESHLAKLRRRGANARRAAMESIPGSSHFRGGKSSHNSDFVSKELLEAFVTHEEFVDEFGGVLQSLRADPKTSQAAKEFLNPYQASVESMEVYCNTDEGKSEIEGLIRDVAGDSADDQTSTQIALAKEAMRQQIEHEIRERIGFNFTTPVLGKVTDAAVKRQNQAQRHFANWLRRKENLSANKRRKKRSKRKKRSNKKSNAKTTFNVSKISAAKENSSVIANNRPTFEQWKRATSRNQYYSMDSETGTWVLRDRPEQMQAKPKPEWIDPEDPSDENPDWDLFWGPHGVETDAAKSCNFDIDGFGFEKQLLLPGGLDSLQRDVEELSFDE